MAMLKIAVGCDPNAASAKAALMQYLGQKGFLLTDFGSDDPIYRSSISVLPCQKQPEIC